MVIYEKIIFGVCIVCVIAIILFVINYYVNIKK